MASPEQWDKRRDRRSSGRRTRHESTDRQVSAESHGPLASSIPCTSSRDRWRGSGAERPWCEKRSAGDERRAERRDLVTRSPSKTGGPRRTERRSSPATCGNTGQPPLDAVEPGSTTAGDSGSSASASRRRELARPKDMLRNERATLVRSLRATRDVIQSCLTDLSGETEARARRRPKCETSRRPATRTREPRGERSVEERTCVHFGARAERSSRGGAISPTRVAQGDRSRSGSSRATACSTASTTLLDQRGWVPGEWRAGDERPMRRDNAVPGGRASAVPHQTHTNPPQLPPPPTPTPHPYPIPTHPQLASLTAREREGAGPPVERNRAP